MSMDPNGGSDWVCIVCGTQYAHGLYKAGDQCGDLSQGQATGCVGRVMSREDAERIELRGELALSPLTDAMVELHVRFADSMVRCMTILSESLAQGQAVITEMMSLLDESRTNCRQIQAGRMPSALSQTKH